MARERPVIIDDDDPPPRRAAQPNDPPPRFGFEWGLASALMGGALLVAGAGGILACMLLWFGGAPDHGRGIDLNLAEVAGGVMCCGAFLMSIFGFTFGIRGLSQARRAGQPAALPVAGILLCVAASLLWLIVTVDFFMIVESFLRTHYF
jgi:hypothetical protein